MSTKGNVNKLILVGNLGKDPEVHQTKTGKPMTTLSIATTREIKNEEGKWIPSTDWHKAVIWGKRATSCAEHLKKGNRVYLEGPIQLRSWVDKEGKERQSPELIVQDIKFLGGGSHTAAVASENSF